MPQSKEQKAVYDKIYYIKNKEIISARVKKYQEDNKEHLASKQKEWKEKNKEALKEWRENNKEHLASKQKEWRENNKEQMIATNKKWRKKNKAQQAAYYRKKKYGVSPEDYDTMLEEQNNKCKICLVSFTTLKPHNIHVDHCHTTKKVRGLLCNLCNVGLGTFKDNTETLTNAIVYLEHTQEKQDETN